MLLLLGCCLIFFWVKLGVFWLAGLVIIIFICLILRSFWNGREKVRYYRYYSVFLFWILYMKSCVFCFMNMFCLVGCLKWYSVILMVYYCLVLCFFMLVFGRFIWMILRNMLVIICNGKFCGILFGLC